MTTPTDQPVGTVSADLFAPKPNPETPPVDTSKDTLPKTDASKVEAMSTPPNSVNEHRLEIDALMMDDIKTWLSDHPDQAATLLPAAAPATPVADVSSPSAPAAPVPAPGVTPSVQGLSVPGTAALDPAVQAPNGPSSQSPGVVPASAGAAVFAASTDPTFAPVPAHRPDGGVTPPQDVTAGGSGDAVQPQSSSPETLPQAGQLSPTTPQVLPTTAPVANPGGDVTQVADLNQVPADKQVDVSAVAAKADDVSPSKVGELKDDHAILLDVQEKVTWLHEQVGAFMHAVPEIVAGVESSPLGSMFGGLFGGKR